MLTTSAMKADAIDNATFVFNNNNTLPNKNILSNAQQDYNLIADSNVSSYAELKNELQNPNTTTINIEGDLSGTEPLGTQQAESITTNGAKHRLTGIDTAGFTLDTSKSLTLSNFIQINGFTNTNGGVIYVTPDSTNTNITINNVIFTNILFLINISINPICSQNLLNIIFRFGIRDLLYKLIGIIINQFRKPICY